MPRGFVLGRALEHGQANKEVTQACLNVTSWGAGVAIGEVCMNGQAFHTVLRAGSLTVALTDEDYTAIACLRTNVLVGCLGEELLQSPRGRRQRTPLSEKKEVGAEARRCE